MDKDTLLKSLSGTLDANYATRKQSEEQLRYFEKIPGFTNYLLELITDPTVNFGVQVSAAIFFKNRVHNYWNVPELRQATDRYIKPEEKAAIKGNLVEVLSKTYKNPQLRKQLSTALSSILDHDKWDELVDMIPKLINDVSNVDHVYTGLICLYEYTKNYRYAGIDNANSKNIVLEGVADSLFPVLEDLASKLMSSPSEVSDEMIYLITKIFKFTTYSTLPTYLQQQGNLGTWCHLHLSIINLPLPESVLKADSQEERALNPRVKAVKWCFANMHRLLLRHGGGLNTKDKNGPFAKMFMSTFVPEILNAYWTIIEGWSTKQIWLSEASLYHLISFLEQIVETPSYPLIEEKLEAIIKHVLLPTLNATQETIELYEDEPDEYIRRFFDTSRDNSTADTASINFLFRLSSTKFSSCGTVLLSIINDIFQRRAADRASLQLAIETEGALRVLATISYKLDKKNSPVKGQMDQLLYTVVYPELSQEVIAKTPWLAARACDTIAMLVHKFSDDAILQNIFHGVVFCFQQQDHFPIQLTAIDALRTLVEEDTVAAQVAEQAPQLMGTLLDMSKNFESDILTTVMDVFVEKFAVNLEPYANELSVRLVEQFMKLANEILEQTSQNGTPDIDKEYQAAGIINTLTSLVIAMNASPQVSENLEVLLKDMIKFVLENSMASFLTEVLEMLESIVFSTNKMSPIMWELFQTCVECFDTFAQDYFDTFQPFFEAIIQCSFANDDITVEDPRVQSMFKICFQTLSGDVVDPVFAHQAFELIEFSILSLNKKFTPFLPQFLPEIFNIFSSLEAQDAFDGYMLHHLSILKIFFACLYVDAGSTLQFLSDKQFTNTFFKLWVKYSGDFQSVYGCKLQILASTAIACEAPLNLLPSEDIVGETVDLLISNMEVLPHAIKARQEIIDKENGAKASSKDYNADGEEDDEFGEDYYDDDFEADEAELEALKQTPIDPINVYYVFTERVSLLQQQDSSRYEAIFGSLDESQKEIANRIINIVHQSSSPFATNNKFEDYFRCYPVAMMPDNVRKDDANFGGKIFLPPSALNKLTMLHIRYPMLFELTNELSTAKTHSGVLEFVAEEGRVYIPQWMMETLSLEPGMLVKIASCDLPNGQFVKIEPQSVDFLDISDPKAVLENALRKFSTLTVGDIIQIDYNDTKFGIKVLEVKPESSNSGICVVETDLETDFAPPVGYVEPEYKPKSITPSTTPIDPSKVSRSAGAGTMARSIDYANIVANSGKTTVFKGEGQKLSGKPTSKEATPSRVTIDDLDPNAEPVPLNLPPTQIFLGWPVVLPTPEESEGEAPSTGFSGEGKSLRQSKKRASKEAHAPLKNHTRSPDQIEIDD